MTPTDAVVLGAVLFAVLCGIVGALVWQEAQRHPEKTIRTYVIDDAIRFVMGRLDPEVANRIGVAGVRRVLEWELHQLQGLAQRQRWRPVETVAGGTDATLDYIVGQISQVNGVTYDRADVAEVLAFETEYLQSIGAIAEPVEPDEGEQEA